MKFDLYKVDESYFDFLRKDEVKVPMIKEDRPFLGIVLNVDYKNYFVPLSSPKEKHKTMHYQQDLIKIKEGELGVINFNNMIPIPVSRCNPIQINQIQDKKYKKLLENQIKWCTFHQEEILQTAKELYSTICYSNTQNTLLRNRCCDFKLLERKCRDYMKQNMLQEEEFLYQVS